jgi:hypothetical protein
VTSGISGATSFSTGGMTINKTDYMPLLVVAGVVALVLFLTSSRRK